MEKEEKQQITYQQIAEICVNKIEEKSKIKKPLLVVVTGDSGSGKSYYSNLIQQELGARGHDFTHIDADDFLISRADREPMKTDYYQLGEFAGKSKWEILENMFRLDEFERVINLLKQNQKATYHPYRRSSGTVVDEDITVEPADIILFDSSMLFELMDLIIMVDVDEEIIIQRKIKRDVDIRTPEQIEEMHRKVQGYYWQRKKPANPDIVIDNSDFKNPSIKLIDR